MEDLKSQYIVNPRPGIEWKSANTGDAGSLRERVEMLTLQQSICMVLGELHSTNTAGFYPTLNRNMELNLFNILSSYYCDISEGKEVSQTRHGLSVRKSCVRRLKTMENIREQRYMR